MAQGAVLNTLVEPYGYTPTDAMIVGVSFVFAGIVGIFVFSFLLDKYHCYLRLLNVATISTSVLICFGYYSLPAGKIAVFAINMAALGFFTVPMVPVGLSFCSEITFPVSVSLAQGIFLLATQLYGTFLSYVSTHIIESGYPLIVITIVLI